MAKDALVRSWYVLHTKSRSENVVNEGLQRKSVEVFLPRIKVKSRRRDRNLMIQVPLFPGYLFVRTSLHPTEHLDILKTAGAVRLIGTRNRPSPVPDDTIESLKIMVSTDHPVITGKSFKKGDRVIVVSGPFTGVTGTVIRYSGKSRVVVNIEALGQYAGVDIQEEDIERLPDLIS